MVRMGYYRNRLQMLHALQHAAWHGIRLLARLFSLGSLRAIEMTNDKHCQLVMKSRQDRSADSERQQRQTIKANIAAALDDFYRLGPRGQVNTVGRHPLAAGDGAHPGFSASALTRSLVRLRGQAAQEPKTWSTAVCPITRPDMILCDSAHGRSSVLL